MENASKALIIAGAILISIILISIGIMVVNSAYGIFDTSTESLTAQEIQAFNSQFENYIGSQRGSSVRTLMTTISSSNASRDEDHQVAVEGPNGETDTDSIRSAVRPTSSYEVSITTDPKSGLIKTISVKSGSANSGSTSK